MPDLLNCPHCGGGAGLIVGEWYVEVVCSTCGASGPLVSDLKFWATRWLKSILLHNRKPVATVVRTYDLDNPWLGGSRIKDHVTGIKTTDAAAVLDRGELDAFVGAAVKKRSGVEHAEWPV